MDFAVELKTQIGLGNFYNAVQNMELFWEVEGKANSK